MANIADKVAAIRQAIFGKDVRESIASGIEAINTEVVNTTARQVVIDGQEQTRINNENARISSESTRVTSEGVRVNSENIRITNETSRQSQESSRQTIFSSNESSRQSTFTVNETDRQNIFETNEDVRIQNDEDRTVQFDALKTEVVESTNNANAAAVNTNVATANYTSVVEQTRKTYKAAVNTYADIITTYPNPEIGWVVTSKDDNIEYRWDGVEWLDIGSNESYSGYGIVVGLTQPTNPNLIWLNAPESTRYSKIIPSPTPPAEVGQIWWETDN